MKGGGRILYLTAENAADPSTSQLYLIESNDILESTLGICGWVDQWIYEP